MVDGRPTTFTSLNLRGTYAQADVGSVSDDDAEWIVPVQWLAQRPLTEAHRAKGLFANPHSACKLLDAFTIEHVTAHFGLDEPEG